MSDSRVITASGGTLTAERAKHEPVQRGVNPLRTGLQTERNPQACAMVIFGVTGDLTSRKLMPALYDLAVASKQKLGEIPFNAFRPQKSRLLAFQPSINGM